MKKYILIPVIIICSIVYTRAGVVDSTTAVRAANNFYSQKTGQSFSVTDVYKISYNNHPSRYIINYSNNGFVMVPAKPAARCFWRAGTFSSVPVGTCSRQWRLSRSAC